MSQSNEFKRQWELELSESFSDENKEKMKRHLKSQAILYNISINDMCDMSIKTIEITLERTKKACDELKKENK